MTHGGWFSEYPKQDMDCCLHESCNGLENNISLRRYCPCQTSGQGTLELSSRNEPQTRESTQVSSAAEKRKVSLAAGDQDLLVPSGPDGPVFFSNKQHTALKKQKITTDKGDGGILTQGHIG